MTDESLTNTPDDLKKYLEALLFVASIPVSIAQMAEALGSKPADVEKALKSLEQEYVEKRGLRLQFFNHKVQLTTAPEAAMVIEKFLGLEATSRLSRAAIETLAIVAYRQPITRPGIDAIRGVNSDGVLKSLLSKGLIEEYGRAESPGRPILYGTTADFLQHFGLSSLSDLPPLELEEAVAENGNLLKD